MMPLMYVILWYAGSDLEEASRRIEEGEYFIFYNYINFSRKIHSLIIKNYNQRDSDCRHNEKLKYCVAVYLFCWFALNKKKIKFVFLKRKNS
jgi:hypothetical protein